MIHICDKTKCSCGCQYCSKCVASGGCPQCGKGGVVIDTTDSTHT